MIEYRTSGTGSFVEGMASEVERRVGQFSDGQAETEPGSDTAGVGTFAVGEAHATAAARRVGRYSDGLEGRHQIKKSGRKPAAAALR
jgi:hypothetical protein